jgi:hypothetical protein
VNWRGTGLSAIDHVKGAIDQGCQIFLGRTYRTGKNLPVEYKIYQIGIKTTKWPQNNQSAIKYTKWLQKFQITMTFTKQAFQNVPKLAFWYANISSGNPALVFYCTTQGTLHIELAEISCAHRKQSKLFLYSSSAHFFTQMLFFSFLHI